MKKSTGAMLVIIIVLLLGVIGIGGIILKKKTNDLNTEIEILQKEILELRKTDKKVEENLKADNFTKQENRTTGINESKKTDTSEVNNNAGMIGTYLNEKTDENYYHKSEIVITSQTEEKIDFHINTIHGRDEEHINIGELQGIATKIDVPENLVQAEDKQLAYQFSEEIDGKMNKITIVYTAHRQFAFINIIEEYPNDINPYGGNRVYFSGEYEKISK